MTDTDDDFLLVARLVGQYVRSPANPFPPPKGFSAGWSDAAVWELTVKLYEKKSMSLAAEARAVAGSNEGHLERRLLATIKNFLIDEAKSTPVGLMRSRLANMLKKNSDFVRVSGAGTAIDGWALDGSPGAAGHMCPEDLDPLKAAAFRVDVPPDTKLNSSGPASKKTKAAMTDVVRATFGAVDGLYIPDQLLARAVYERFKEFWKAERQDAVDHVDRMDFDENIGDTDVTYEDVEAADIADHIWSDMSPAERRAFPAVLGAEDVDAGRDAVMSELGCRRHEATAIVKSIHDRIRTENLGEDPVEVVRALARLAALAGLEDDSTVGGEAR